MNSDTPNEPALLTRRVVMLAAGSALIAPRIALAALPKMSIAFPWVRATRQQETKGYCIILNDTAEEDQLLHIDSPWADKCKLQKAQWRGLKMSLVDVPELPIPAYSRTELRPGGMWIHIRLARAAVKGDSMPLSFRFARAGRVEIDATITDRMLGVSKNFG